MLVRIAEGPFVDYTGKIDDVYDEKERVKVMINLFGRDTPVELDWFTLLNKNGDIVYETSGGGSFYKELKHQTNFESVDELLNWYEEFYLPEVYNLAMNTLVPKMHKLADYEIKQRG